MPGSFTSNLIGIKKLRKAIQKAPHQIARATGMMLNEYAFGTRNAAIETIHTRMVVRAPAFVASRLRVTKSHKRLPIATQRSEIGSIESPRFSGWVEQQTGKKTTRKKTIQLAARRGSMKRRVVPSARLKPGNEIPTPERYQGRTSQARVLAMLFALDRGGHRGAFIVRGHPKIRSGLYKFGRKRKGRRSLTMLQDFRSRKAQPKRIPWMMIARNTFFRRFDQKRVWYEILKKGFWS